jgi:hypothetical protein
VYIPSQFFNTTDRAKFFLNIDKDIAVSKVVTDTTEISSLDSNETTSSNVIMDSSNKPLSAFINIPSIIIQGSAIRFELQVD